MEIDWLIEKEKTFKPGWGREREREMIGGPIDWLRKDV